MTFLFEKYGKELHLNTNLGPLCDWALGPDEKPHVFDTVCCIEKIGNCQ